MRASFTNEGKVNKVQHHQTEWEAFTSYRWGKQYHSCPGDVDGVRLWLFRKNGYQDFAFKRKFALILVIDNQLKYTCFDKTRQLLTISCPPPVNPASLCPTQPGWIPWRGFIGPTFLGLAPLVSTETSIPDYK
jgi:hypothetical protein